MFFIFSHKAGYESLLRHVTPVTVTQDLNPAYEIFMNKLIVLRDAAGARLAHISFLYSSIFIHYKSNRALSHLSHSDLLICFPSNPATFLLV